MHFEAFIYEKLLEDIPSYHVLEFDIPKKIPRLSVSEKITNKKIKQLTIKTNYNKLKIRKKKSLAEQIWDW